MRQREKPSTNRRSRFLKTEPRKPSFRFFLNFEIGLVLFLETNIRNFHRIPHTPTTHASEYVGISKTLTRVCVQVPTACKACLCGFRFRKALASETVPNSSMYCVVSLCDTCVIELNCTILFPY